MRKAEERASDYIRDHEAIFSFAEKDAFIAGYEQALKDIGQEEDIEFFFEPYE